MRDRLRRVGKAQTTGRAPCVVGKDLVEDAEGHGMLLLEHDDRAARANPPGSHTRFLLAIWDPKPPGTRKKTAAAFNGRRSAAGVRAREKIDAKPARDRRTSVAPDARPFAPADLSSKRRSEPIQDLIGPEALEPMQRLVQACELIGRDAADLLDRPHVLLIERTHGLAHVATLVGQLDAH